MEDDLQQARIGVDEFASHDATLRLSYANHDNLARGPKACLNGLMTVNQPSKRA